MGVRSQIINGCETPKRLMGELAGLLNAPNKNKGGGSFGEEEEGAGGQGEWHNRSF